MATDSRLLGENQSSLKAIKEGFMDDFQSRHLERSKRKCYCIPHLQGTFQKQQKSEQKRDSLIKLFSFMPKIVKAISPLSSTCLCLRLKSQQAK